MSQLFKLDPLQPAHLPELAEWWRLAHPLHPLTSEILQERLWGAGSDPDLLLAARGPRNELLGIVAGVFPCRQPEIGGIRWIGVSPEGAPEGVLEALLEAISGLLAMRGATQLRLLATPPYYLRPGIDTRETGLIGRLEALGWKRIDTHFNMTCDLAQWRTPGLMTIFGLDERGNRVRRASAADLHPLREMIERHWSVGWRDAASLAFQHDPPSVFIAEGPDGLAGFSCYEVDQCLGSFGPTGVVPAQQGLGLGRRLLWACLDDLVQLGRRECQIGWIGPVQFYHRSCGAVLGPAFWEMGRSVDPGRSILH